MPPPVITLFQSPALCGIPSRSPFGTEAETYLRTVDLPWCARSGEPRPGQTGKIPDSERPSTVDCGVFGSTSTMRSCEP